MPIDVTGVTYWISGLANSPLSHLSIGWGHVRHLAVLRGLGAVLPGAPGAGPPLRAGGGADLRAGSSEHDLQPGDKLPAERELAARLGVSRATLSQALVALEVIGAVAVRHGDGTVVGEGAGRLAHRRGGPRPRRPPARDHRDPRRAGDQDRQPRGLPADRRRPAAHRGRAGPDGGGRRGRRPRRRGRRALPCGGDGSGAQPAPVPADGRDRPPDPGDADRVAVAARPAEARRWPVTGPSPTRSARATPRARLAPCTRTSRWSATWPSCAPRDAPRAGGRALAGLGSRHPDVHRRRRLAPELPGAGGRRAAAGGGQRLQHGGPDPGGAQRVVGLPRRAARAPARHGDRPGHLRRRLGGRRRAAARAARVGLRERRAVAHPRHLPPRRHPAAALGTTPRASRRARPTTACTCRR